MESITGKVALGSFWGMVGLFALLDLLKWPKSLYKLKIQTNKEPPSPTYFAQIAALNVASTVLLLGPIGKYIIHPIWLKRGGVEHTIKGIPSAWTSLKEFVACEWWFQFWLYTSHRIMHLPSFYSWAHKRWVEESRVELDTIHASHSPPSPSLSQTPRPQLPLLRRQLLRHPL